MCWQKERPSKKFAKDRLKELLDEHALLAEFDGAITVTGICDAFLDDALHNLDKSDVQVSIRLPEIY
jgi:hypothetical protein